jgi:hypothetical protein
MITLQAIERRCTTEPMVEFAGETRAIGLGLGRSLVLSVVGEAVNLTGVLGRRLGWPWWRAPQRGRRGLLRRAWSDRAMGLSTREKQGGV